MAKATKSKSASSNHPAGTESAAVSSPWKTGVNRDNLKSLTLPPVVKIKEMPVGATLDVTIYDLVPSPKKNIKNPLALAINHNDGSKITIPVVGGLSGTILADKEKVDLAKVTADDLSDEIRDIRVLITKTGFKDCAGEYQEDGKPTRQYPIFEVAVAE